MIELIIAERTHRVLSRLDDCPVAIRVAYEEAELRRLVKDRGGKWDPARRVWKLDKDVVVKLGLRNRIVGGAEHS